MSKLPDNHPVRQRELAQYRKLFPIAEAKRYLQRLGVNPDTTVDPNELLAQLVATIEPMLTPSERAFLGAIVAKGPVSLSV